MSATTPRTDAAWAASFEGKQLSAGQTARALRECSQQLERELAALTAERDQLHAALALGQENCDAVYDELRGDCDELRGDVVRLTAERDQLRAENSTLRAGQKACEACDEPTAFEVRQLRARAERAEGALAASRYETVQAAQEGLRECIRAEKAEAELAAEREKVRLLRSALENLCDEQNGAPLETRRDQWQLAMDEARAAIVATEDAK